MADVIRGTTPDFIIDTDIDLSDKTVYVEIAQLRNHIKLTEDNLSIATDENGSTVALTLTQKQTLSLSAGKAELEIGAINAEGKTWKSDQIPINITRTIIDREMVYSG